MPCFYESFIKGLTEAGNEVMISAFSPQNVSWELPTPPKKIEQKVKKFSPDLVILFNNCGYQWEHVLDCPIVIYEVDSPLLYHNKQNLEKNASRFQFIVPQPSSLKILRSIYPSLPPSQTVYLPFFTSVQTEPVPQTDNISIICSLFGQSDLLGPFMKSSPTKEEILQYKKIWSIVEQNPFITPDNLFSLINSLSDKVKNATDIPDIILATSSSRRVQLLSSLTDLGLALYGTSNWTDLPHEPELVMSYKNTPIHSLKQNQDVYNRSKIGININHIQAKTGFSWRVMDIMASNACLVTETQDIYQTLFPGIGIPQYKNRFEAREICQKLLREDSLREDITQSCQAVIEQKYRFPQLLDGMESFLNCTLRNEGEYTDSVWLQLPASANEHAPASVNDPAPTTCATQNQPSMSWKESFYLKASLSKKTRLRFSILKRKG